MRLKHHTKPKIYKDYIKSNNNGEVVNLDNSNFFWGIYRKYTPPISMLCLIHLLNETEKRIMANISYINDYNHNTLLFAFYKNENNLLYMLNSKSKLYFKNGGYMIGYGKFLNKNIILHLGIQEYGGVYCRLYYKPSLMDGHKIFAVNNLLSEFFTE